MKKVRYNSPRSLRVSVWVLYELENGEVELYHAFEI